jgi:hypothetical protein
MIPAEYTFSLTPLPKQCRAEKRQRAVDKLIEEWIKSAGMHLQSRDVTSMLALRAAIC